MHFSIYIIRFELSLRYENSLQYASLPASWYNLCLTGVILFICLLEREEQWNRDVPAYTVHYSFVLRQQGAKLFKSASSFFCPSDTALINKCTFLGIHNMLYVCFVCQAVRCLSCDQLTFTWFTNLGHWKLKVCNISESIPAQRKWFALHCTCERVGRKQN